MKLKTLFEIVSTYVRDFELVEVADSRNSGFALTNKWVIFDSITQHTELWGQATHDMN